jgi:hypothetical protein
MKSLSFLVIAIAVLAIYAPLTHAVDGHPAWNTQINSPGRFTVLTQFNKEAIFDKETGLVWERSPDTSAKDWYSANYECINKSVHNRKGWRLPTIEELASLVAWDQLAPHSMALPLGHPFLNVQYGGYWSATSWGSDDAWISSFNFPVQVYDNKTNDAHFWCVRGGQGVDAQ